MLIRRNCHDNLRRTLGVPKTVAVASISARLSRTPPLLSALLSLRSHAAAASRWPRRTMDATDMVKSCRQTPPGTATVVPTAAPTERTCC